MISKYTYFQRWHHYHLVTVPLMSEAKKCFIEILNCPMFYYVSILLSQMANSTIFNKEAETALFNINIL